MKELNPRLLEFFTGHYQPGTIGLVGARDTLGLAIREAQGSVTQNGKASLWSHCFLLGEMRLDRRGPGGATGMSPYLFESDLQIKLFQPQLRNGAQENWIGKWCREQVEHAAVIDFGLTEAQSKDILATALQLVDEQVLYPLQELLGTWWAIIMKKQWQPNPFDDPHAMYCSAFVRYGYQKVGRDFLGQEIALSNTTPEDIARAGINANALKRYTA